MAEERNSNLGYIDEDLESEFDFENETSSKRKLKDDLITKTPQIKHFKPNRQSFHDQCALEQGRSQQQAFMALDAYTRHKKLINEYVLCYRGSTEKLKRNTSHYKTDHDVIRENHRFLWEEDDDAETWGQQLAKKYYDRLFKEYCLCDLSRYKEKKVGMRWRTEKELVLGKGQFFCGNINCEKKEELNSWEVLFSYMEHGEKKSALVKLRLCEKCSDKLHYGYKGKAALKKRQRKHKSEEDKSFSKEESIKESIQEDSASTETAESNIWKQPVKEEAEQSKEETFEQFLEDLFL